MDLLIWLWWVSNWIVICFCIDWIRWVTVECWWLRILVLLLFVGESLMCSYWYFFDLFELIFLVILLRVCVFSICLCSGVVSAWIWCGWFWFRRYC